MFGGPPDRLREVGAQAEHTLNKYQEGVQGAELRARVAGGPDADGMLSSARVRNVALVWTIVAVVIAGVATLLLDPVMAAWTVVAATAMVIVVRLSRWRTTPPPNTAR
ncbi:MAG: hypothetical protein ACHQ0J_12900 [Candidatus Dormibacterales bacterium]